jgi:hypothetical protein
MKTFIYSLLALAAYSFSPAQAQFLSIPVGNDRNDNQISGVGFIAAANAPVVDYVGYFINPNDTNLTLQSSHPVGIYTQTIGGVATLVEQGLISAGATATSASGSYAWVQLSTPVTLIAGVKYNIVTSNGNGDYWNGNVATVTVDDSSFGTLDTGGYDQNGDPFTTTLATTYTFGGPNYYGGNIASSISVPEPSTWALMLGGLGLLAFVVRRRAVSAR